MRGHLLDAAGKFTDASATAIDEALESKGFFWLDLIDLGEDGSAILADHFGFHPLAVEDAEHFGQRPKVDEYDDFVYLVMHGAEPLGAGTIEVHFFYSSRFLVTVRRAECLEIDNVREHAARRQQQGELQPIMLLYRVTDAIVDTFFPVLASFDDRIDELEDAILERPTEAQLGSLFEMKRNLVGLRKVVTAERDMFSGLVGGALVLPEMTPDSERYFRDLYDHLIRVSDLVDSYRDLLTGALDTHLSTVSNRLNQVMKQLTVIATIFLPLSFVTGFFGQNFAFMINRITGSAAFFGLAIGLEIAIVVALLYMFRKRGWLGG